MTSPSVASQRLQKREMEMEGALWESECTTLCRERYYLSRFIAIDKPFRALTISSAMRGGREVVGICVRRDEVKPAFKQQQQLAAPDTADQPPLSLAGYG